ncbi:MAG: PQQ-dependent sugar dehydrogenase [Pseudomonadota bacterium]
MKYALGALGLALFGPSAALAADPTETQGGRISLIPGDLAAPYASPSVSNSARIIPRPPGVAPQVPSGFQANLFAEGLNHARWLAVAPNGDVFLAEPALDQITILRDQNGDGQADLIRAFASGFESPHGMAFAPGWLYVADLEGIWRIAYDDGDTSAGGESERITPSGAFGAPGGHWTRNIALSPDGGKIYAAIGSRGNIEEEPLPRASVQVFNVDGSDQETFAWGLRNPLGIAFAPQSEDLYVVVNERDDMGDDLVPDYLTRIQKGEFFGWPYAYIGPNPQPGSAEPRPDLVDLTEVPGLLFCIYYKSLGLYFNKQH